MRLTGWHIAERPFAVRLGAHGTGIAEEAAADLRLSV